MWVKKHESQACDRDKLKLKAVVLHDGNEEVHMTQPDRFMLKIQYKYLSLMELISLNYGWLDPLGKVRRQP